MILVIYKIYKMLKINLNNIQIKPITNEEEFDAAGDIIDALMDADLIEDPIERKKALDILEAITILAVEYEKKHYPIPEPNPIEAIRECMEQLNLSQKDVAKYFGGENRVSEILSGKRQLTVNMIRNLNKYLHIPANTLLGIGK
jgi:HTH-type transcriptional regulator / antitoxin HigA